MVRSVESRNHMGVRPDTNFQRSKKLQSAFQLMSKGGTTENKIRQDKTENREGGQENNTHREQGRSILSPRRTVNINKSSRPEGQEGSKYIRRDKDGSVDNSEDEAMELTKERYNMRKSLPHKVVKLKKNVSRHRGSVSPERRSEEITTTSNSESFESVHQYENETASGSMTKTEKLWSKRRFRQREILAKKKKTQKGIGSVASDFVSKIVGQLDFSHSFVFPTSPSVGESDVNDDDGASRLEKHEHSDDTSENRDTKIDDTTTFFKLLSWDERKTNQIVDDSYDGYGIDAHSHHSVGKEAKLVSFDRKANLDMAGQENYTRSTTVAEKQRSSIYNPVASFASQPLDFKINFSREGQEQGRMCCGSADLLPWSRVKQPKTNTVYAEQSLESNQYNMEAADQENSIRPRTVPEENSLPVHDSFTPFASKPLALNKEEVIEEDATNVQARRDNFLICTELDLCNCAVGTGSRQPRPVHNQQVFESNRHIFKDRDDQVVWKSEEATSTNSYFTSNMRNDEKSIVTESSKIPVESKNDDGISTITSNYRVENTFSPPTTDKIPTEITTIESITIESIAKVKHINMQDGNDVEDRDHVTAQKMQNSHENPINVIDNENAVTDRVKFQNIPDKSNLSKLDITNESEDRTMPSNSQRDQQIEFISTLQAHISNELTLSTYDASSNDQKHDQFVKELVSKEDIVNDSESRSDGYRRDYVERSVNKNSSKPETSYISPHRNGSVSTLEELLSSIVASDSKQTNIDDLILNIDDVVHCLIKEGKLPGSNETSDLQQMNLRNNTAELLRNLSVLRAHRAAVLKHNKNTDSQLHVAGKLDTPSPQIQKPSIEGIFHSEIKCFDTSLAHMPSPSVLKIDQLTTPMKGKDGDDSEHGPVSNLAKIRVRHNEAAMRIRQQTQKLAILRNEPSTFCPDRSDSKSLSSRRPKMPPRPEDVYDRDDRLGILLSHVGSHFDPKADSSLLTIPVCTDDSNVSSLLPMSNPCNYGNNSENVGVKYLTHKTPTKNINKIISFTSRMNAGSGTPIIPHKSIHSENHEFYSATHDQLYQSTDTVSSSLGDIPRTNFTRPSVPTSISDIDMLEWEKIEIKKLPLILNPSQTEQWDSKDEYEEYYSTSEVTTAYDTDDNYNSCSDDEDTMGDETLGSASDSTRLKHIASMIDELKLRSRNER
jgi:hypothetical protein